MIKKCLKLIFLFEKVFQINKPAKIPLVRKTQAKILNKQNDKAAIADIKHLLKSFSN